MAKQQTPYRMTALTDIRPYERNPRIIPQAAVDAVARSIQAFGFRQPIVVDGNGVILAGHTRYKAAQQLGMAAVPVVWQTDITDIQARGYRIADNKVAELSAWDRDALDIEVKELAELGDIDIGEFGKSKDDKGIRIFNVSLAFDKTNRIPLFYEEYPGSITDVSQFKYMVDKSEEFGYKKLGFILDRGYFSKSNIQYMDERGYEFVIMVRGNRELVSSVIRDHKNTFETDRSCSIRAYRVYGTTIRTKLYSGDSKDRYFHLYYNPYKQAAEREILEQKIDRYHRYLEKHIGDRVDFSRTYKEYFELIYDKDHKLVGIAERENVVQRQLELCGYFCIISSEKMTAEQALIRYKGRDASEKLFSADKSFLGSRSMRVQSEEAVSAKIFIEFTALIVRNRIYNLLKETMLRLEKTPNFMTVPAAIRELEKIEMIKVNQGRYRLDHAVTKKQKIILSSFGMDEDDIRRTAAEISQLLEKNQSMMDRETEDERDGENENDNID